MVRRPAPAIAYDLIQNHITAAVEDATLDVASLAITADSDALIVSVAVGAAGGQDFALGGSIAVDSIANVVDAHLLRSEVVAAGDVVVGATETATLISIAGGIGIATSGPAVGAALAYSFIGGSFDPANRTSSTTPSRLRRPSRRGSMGRPSPRAARSSYPPGSSRPASVAAALHVDLGDGITIDLTFPDFGTQLVSVTVGASGANGVAVSGSISIAVVAITIEAAIDGGSNVGAQGSVLVAAADDSTVTSVAGQLAIGTSAAVGVANSTVVVNGSVLAWIGAGSLVDAAGNGAGVAIPAVTPTGGRTSQTVNGVAVVAVTRLTITSVAAGGSASVEAGVAGSVTVTVITTTTRAWVAQDASVNTREDAPAATQSVIVRAIGRLDHVAVAGALALGGEAGVGAGVDVLVLSKDTQASIDRGADVVAAANVIVEAISDEDVTSVAAGVAVGGTAGVAGGVGVHVITVTTRARIGPAAMAVGTVLSFSAGTITRTSGSWLTDGFVVGQFVMVSGAGANDGSWLVTGVTATSLSVTAVGRTLGAAQDVTGVTISVASPFATTVAAGGSVVVTAIDRSEMDLIDGSIAGGGVAGIGGSIGVPIVHRTTEAFIGRRAEVDAEARGAPVTVPTGGFGTVNAPNVGKTGSPILVFVDAPGGDRIVRASGSWIADGFAVGQRIRVSGTTSNDGVYEIATVTATTLTLTPAAVLTAETVLAPASAHVTIGLDGEVVQPSLGALTDVDALKAKGLAVTDQRVVTMTTDSGFSGVAVVAVSIDDIEIYGVGAGGSGVASVQVSGVVHVADRRTNAWIGDGAAVNQAGTGDTDQEVLVAAGSDVALLGIAGAVAGSGVAAVVPGVVVAVLTTRTTAFIGVGAAVAAKDDVTVAATSRQHVLSIAIGAAGSGVAAVGGAVSVVYLDVTTEAWIGTAATVAAGANVVVAADAITDVGGLAIGAGIGGVAGVGAGVGVIVIDKRTRAFIDHDAHVDATANGGSRVVVDGTINGTTGAFGLTDAADDVRGVIVSASSRENVVAAAIAASGAAFGGFSGAVTVQVVDADTQAFIADGASVNVDPTGANAHQDVVVVAVDDLRTYVVGGAVSGAAVGAGGAVDVGVYRNDTTAWISGGDVRARRDVIVRALANRDVASYVVAVAGGGVGVSGAVTVQTIGGDLALTYGFDANNDGTIGASERYALLNVGQPGNGTVQVLADGELSPSKADSGINKITSGLGKYQPSAAGSGQSGRLVQGATQSANGDHSRDAGHAGIECGTRGAAGAGRPVDPTRHRRVHRRWRVGDGWT